MVFYAVQLKWRSRRLVLEKRLIMPLFIPRSFVLFLCLSFLQYPLNAQWITDGDFSESSGCPGALGQISNLTHWFNVVNSADFYDCGYTNPSFFPIDEPDGFCGSGFVGFASYGNGVGAAEAIGQQLAEPFVAGQTYQFTAMVKMSTGGSYSDVCTGLCLYGFMNQPPVVTGEHPSMMVGAEELGCTETISNTDWQEFSFEFTPTQDYPFIVLGPGFAPNCPQNLFMDCVDVVPTNSNVELELCEGESITIEPELGVLDWYEVDGGNLVFLESGATFTYNGSSDIELQAEGTSDVINVFITVTPNPVPDLGEDLEICEGEEATFTLTTAYDEVLWNGVAGGQSFTTSEAGAIEVVVTDNNGCNGSDQAEVVVLETPGFSALQMNPASCPGACDGSISFETGSNVSITVNGLAATTSIEDLCAGSYTIELAIATCLVSETVEVTELTQPVITLPETVTICIGSEVELTASSPNELTYTWDNGEEGASITVSPQAGDVFCVSGVNASGCEAEIQCIEVLTYPALEVSLPDDLDFCPGDALNILASTVGGEGPISFAWTVNGAAQAATGNSLEFNPTETSEIIVTATDDCVTSGPEDALTATMALVPEPQLSQSDEVICVPGAVSFEVTNSDDYLQMSWLLNEEAINGATSVYNFDETGCYDMEFTAITPEGCSVAQTLPDAVCVLPIPTAAFSVPRGNRIYMEEGDFPTINTSLNASTYLWRLDGVEISSETDLILEEFALPGTYQLCLEAFNDLGCNDEICTEITVLDRPSVFIPSAFTPDQDGINEVFQPVLAFETEFYECLIFDRWGTEVFRSNDPDAWWDGDFQGGNYYVRSEVYLYQVTVEMPDTGKKEVFSGHVTVMR